MEKSPPPGTCSLVCPEHDDQNLGRLISICESSEIQLLRAALGSHAQLHLVGGSVRDVMAGKSAKDLDLATALPATECLALLNEKKIRVIETGIKHGTITAVINHQNIEITSFRPQAAPPGLPASSLTIELDLAARDFTINAIAFSVDQKKLIDPFHGVSDLCQNILRAVGNPEDRFSEDPLRIMRMLRFGPAAKRLIEPATFAAAQRLVTSIEKVSIERVRTELEGILVSPAPAEAFRQMHKLGLLQLILPEMIASIGFEQNEYHIHDVFEHTLSVIERSPLDLRVRLAALFHDFGKPASLSIGEGGRRHFFNHENISEQLCLQAMERLKFSHEQIKAVRLLVAMHMRPVECGPTGVRRLLRELGEHFEDWKLLKRADSTPTIAQCKTDAAMQQFENLVEIERNRTHGSIFSKLAVDGNDLLQLGYKQGPELGAVLKKLLDQVIENPEANDRELLLRIAKESLPKM